jgi:pyruvate dehydrogenase E1 component alpha subunit
MGDPERYRKADEVHRYQENDPIGMFRKYLIANSIASEEEIVKLEDAVEEEVRDAVEFAENSPEPAPEELFTNVYVETY